MLELAMICFGVALVIQAMYLRSLDKKINALGHDFALTARVFELEKMVKRRQQRKLKKEAGKIVEGIEEAIKEALKE